MHNLALQLSATVVSNRAASSSMYITIFSLISPETPNLYHRTSSVTLLLTLPATANEINGVRILRKGRGVRPLEHHQAVEEDELSPSLSHHRKGKPSALQTADTTGSSGGGYSRRVLSYKGCIYPVDQVEQPWLLKSRGKPAHVPPEQNEQQWPSKGKKIITGRSHVHQ